MSIRAERPIPQGRLRVARRMSGGDLAVGRLEELCDLVPVDGSLMETHGDPTPISMVWRGREAIGQEVQRLPGGKPALARRRVAPIEEREAPVADAEERTVLEFGLHRVGEAETDRSNVPEGFAVVRGTDHTGSLHTDGTGRAPPIPDRKPSAERRRSLRLRAAGSVT